LESSWVFKMVIEFLLEHHDRFLALCNPPSRAHEVLKSGLVVRRSKEGRYEREVEIFAEIQDGRLLLALAYKICPVAVPAILKAISKARHV
jgi:hypothetical protein